MLILDLNLGLDLDEFEPEATNKTEALEQSTT